MHKENRSYSRLAMHAKANLHLNDESIEGEVENLSMNGAFVTAVRQMKLNDVVAFTVYDTTTCAIKAKVVRVTDKGIGLQFAKPLLD
jgi:hypothetical protein